MKDTNSPAVYILNMAYTGLGIARSLANEGVRINGLGSRKWVSGNFSRFAEFKRSPDSQEAPEALSEFLIELAKSSNTKGIIFPTRDHDVIFLKKYQAFM